MKLKATLMFFLLFSISLFAQSKKSELMNDMKSMLVAMEMIQSAGLYSNPKGMNDGVELLLKSIKKMAGSDVKHILPKKSSYAYKFANKRAKMIKMYAEDLMHSVKVNNISDALDDYSQILRQCTSCHSRIREW